MRFFVGTLEGWRHLDGDEERSAPQTRHLIGRRQPGERGEKSRMRRRPADGAQRAWANPARSGRRRPGALARAWHGRARRGRGGAQRCWPRARPAVAAPASGEGQAVRALERRAQVAGGAVWVEGRRRRRAETARRRRGCGIGPSGRRRACNGGAGAGGRGRGTRAGGAAPRRRPTPAEQRQEQQGQGQRGRRAESSG